MKFDKDSGESESEDLGGTEMMFEAISVCGGCRYHRRLEDGCWICDERSLDFGSKFDKSGRCLVFERIDNKEIKQ